MAMKDAIVIGCGIIGATISKSLVRAGMEVLTLDDGRSMSGTAASGGHMKPSWFPPGVNAKEYEKSLEILDEIWGLVTEEFVLYPKKEKTTVHRVNTEIVLATSRTISKVQKITNLKGFPTVIHQFGEDSCKILIVATGIWVGELLPSIQLIPKQGVSFRLGGSLSEPIIKQWAPYKQVVAHQQRINEIWVGDGSTIMPKNWGKDRNAECLARCREVVGNGPLQKTIMGIRPYHKGKQALPCLIQKLGPRTWVVAGSGKSGTIASGWAAGRILDALPS